MYLNNCKPINLKHRASYGNNMVFPHPVVARDEQLRNECPILQRRLSYKLNCGSR